MTTASWLKFEWDLSRLSPSEITVPAAFVLRSAEKDDEGVVQKVTTSAISMDTGWGNPQKSILEKMRESAGQCFEKDGKNRCIVLQHGSRIIGSSVLHIEEEAESHLLTGPCILHEYRSRGLGTLLLHASLAALREAGLSRARGITPALSAAARYVYPKFGGTGEPWTPAAEPPAKLAA